LYGKLQTTKDTTEKVQILNSLCWKYRNFNPDTAIYFGLQAIKLSKGSKNNEDIVNTYSYTGVAYRNKGIYSKALELYYKGASLAEFYKEYEVLTYAYINIANIHIYRNDMEGALSFLNKANRSSILVNNELQKSYIYINLGRVHTSLRNFEKAHYFIDKSLEIRQQLNDKGTVAVSLKYKGDLLSSENNTEEALYKYHEALQISEELNEDKDLISDILHKIAKIYVEQSNFSEAERYAKKSLAISEEIGIKFRVKDASYLLAVIYSMRHQYKDAYAYYVTYSITKDTLFSTESNREITNLQTEFEIEKQQKENEILRAKRATDKEILRKREILIVSIAIGFFLLLIIIVILLNLVKIKKDANILLTQKNAKIEQIASELDSANKTKARFFSIIAHDLKNPFNVIIGFSNLLKSNIDDFERDRIIMFADRIYDTSLKAYALLENLLEWAKSQTNSIAYSPSKILFNTLVNENVELLKSNGIKKNTILVNNLKSDFYVFADANMINTVLRNLISNALKFTKDGSVSISSEKIDKFYKISIEDTGVGISKEVLTNLFEIDKAISSAGTDGELGSGIGLILCKEFISKHGGTISVESKKGVGSIFSFTLPEFKE